MYKVGDTVYYRGKKVKIVFIDRMGQCLTNIMGYNEWIFHGDMKPMIKLYATVENKGECNG